MGVREFWDLTPRELVMISQARTWQRKQEYDRERWRSAWQVWHGEALHRTKKLPSLKRLAGEQETIRLTGEEAEEAKRQHEELVARMGRSTTKGTKDTK